MGQRDSAVYTSRTKVSGSTRLRFCSTESFSTCAARKNDFALCARIWAQRTRTDPTPADDGSSSAGVVRIEVAVMAAGSDLAAQDHAGLLGRADELDPGFFEGTL
jgi:hypothetical protein